MAIKFDDYQLKAISEMHNGCILCGAVGSGKSLTALGYYYLRNGGDINNISGRMKAPKDLYIITTARKRDTFEWDNELSRFLLSIDDDKNGYKNKVRIDSWNNIAKYVGIYDAFFIFDEQRVVGKGAWVNSFLKITKVNEWILLSATPGDNWTDYIPVFIANGYYKNRSEFKREHIIYSPYTKFPKVDRYINTGRLIRLRNRTLVDMDYMQPAECHHIDIYVDYDKAAYKNLVKTRWNASSEAPISSSSEFCFELRKIVNSNEKRATEALRLAREHSRVIIFYSYDYELDILRTFGYDEDFVIAEWNGHKHESIPECDKWIYLVQYTAGCEGWNCISTDTIIFYSQSYSYKVMEQAAGRINRRNTPFKDLYFYHLKSRAPIDIAISRAINEKKRFNERRFVDKYLEK